MRSGRVLRLKTPRCGMVQVEHAAVLIQDEHHVGKAFKQGEIPILLVGHQPISGLKLFNQLALVGFRPLEAIGDLQTIEETFDQIKAKKFKERSISSIANHILVTFPVVFHQPKEHA
ncbi:MAG: hypothetical protein ACD_75C02618G0003 [uncultured bacterium]|nr:MAG: hypothetical protein ACD_75C02618G0003 [uncultured bacterium]